MSEERDAQERASRFRACAARLREFAAMASGDPFGPEYVEELATEFDSYADALLRNAGAARR
jgi:hypothetical protein